jgi:hypothetical protein
MEKIEHAFYIQRPFFKNNSVVCETMCKNIVEPDKPKMTICHKQMATNSHSEYVKCIPLPLQK